MVSAFITGISTGLTGAGFIYLAHMVFKLRLHEKERSIVTRLFLETPVPIFLLSSLVWLLGLVLQVFELI